MLAGRFEPGKVLKSAAGVVTRLGLDHATGRAVVVKSADVSRVPPGTTLRLEHEASVLRDVHSASLVPLVQVGLHERQLFVVTPYVGGPTLEQRLADGPLPLAEAIRVGLDLLQGLRDLHEHGVLHRDVKPANVLLAEDGSARLVDLGLSRSSALHRSLRDVPVGTVLYLSPEGAGLVRGDVDERSDLYAVGAVLYACLAGRPPFLGERAGEVLRRHLSEPPAPLRPQRPEVSRPLETFVLRLLRKDPRERYQTAAAARAALQAVAVGAVEPEAPRDAVTEPAFVGRSEELAFLTRSLGWSGLLLVEAPSGGGKTRLLEEFAAEALGRGTRVLRASGAAGATLGPLGSLAGLAADLVTAGEEDPAWREQLQARLGAQADALLSAMPALEPLFGSAGASAAREAQAESRTLAAVARLLSSLGDAVVLLDDLQWFDELSTRAVAAWAAAPGGGTLVVAAARQGEVPPALGAPGRHLALPPLPDEAIGTLARSMVGEVAPEVARLLARLSEGSPFMAEALLLGMVESGFLERGPDAWVPRRGGDLRASRRAAALLSRRVEALPAPARSVLATAAVLGREVRLDVLAAAAGGDVVSALLEGVRRHLLWQNSAGTVFRFVHDRIRESFLEAVDESTLREVHRRAALHAEATGGSAFDLAHHWDQAGEPGRAAGPALQAAEEARSRTDFAVAERYFRIAGNGLPEGGPLRFRATFGLAQVLALRGRYEECFALFEAALAQASTRVERVSVLLTHAEARQRHAETSAARTLLLEGLAEMGHPAPRSPLGMALQTARALAGRSLPGASGRRRLTSEEYQTLLLYDQLLQTAWHSDQPMTAIWAQTRGLVLSDLSLPEPQVARTYAIQASLLEVMGFTRAALRNVAQADAMLAADASPYERGKTLAPTGAALLHLGEVAEAARRLLESERALETAGDAWELASCRYFLGRVLMRQGDFAGSLARARATFRDSGREGDLLNATSALQLWGLLHLAARGVPEPPPPPAEWSETTLRDIPVLQFRKGEAWRLLAQGRFEEAARRLRGARRRGGVPLGEEDAEVHAWLATCLRLAAGRTAHPGHRQDLLREARAVARQAAALAGRFPCIRIHVLRESGLLAALRGHEERARRLLDESCAEAASRGMAYEEARSRLERARVGRAFGWPGHDAEEREAIQRLQELGARPLPGEEPWEEAEPPVTLSLADRFDTLLEHGRRIATARTTPEVLETAREAALLLLRAQEARVVPVPLPESLPGVSRTLAARALQTGQPVLADEGLPEDPSESVILQGARSLLCLPVHVHGTPAALLYLWHAGVAGLFGEEEVRIARFVATVAGAALENVHGTEELRASEERFRTLFQSAGTGIALLDREGRVVDANPLLADMVGQRLADLVVFQGADELRTASVARPVSLEVQVTRPGREPAWMQLTLAPVPGEGERRIATLSDVTTRRLEQVVRFQETERRLLSAELHDSVSQGLVGLGYALEVALRVLERQPARARDSVQQAREQATRLVQDVGTLMFDLRSPLVDGLDLGEAVRGLVDGVRSRGLEVQLEATALDGHRGLGALFAFRIVQEALTNARRHGAARLAQVRLEFAPGRVCGTVRDDGQGFDPAAPPPDGRRRYGLVGMRERAELLGGRLEVHSAPGQGTVVEFELPLLEETTGPA